MTHGSDEESQALTIHMNATSLEILYNSTRMTNAGPFDVLADLKDLEDRSVAYEELLTRSTLIQGNGLSVHVASFDDLIVAKSFANREKDLEDIPQTSRHSRARSRYERWVRIQRQSCCSERRTPRRRETRSIVILVKGMRPGLANLRSDLIIHAGSPK